MLALWQSSQKQQENPTKTGVGELPTESHPNNPSWITGCASPHPRAVTKLQHREDLLLPTLVQPFGQAAAAMSSA